MPPELFYGGEVRGESAVKVENDIGGEVVHRYEVSTCNHSAYFESESESE